MLIKRILTALIFAPALLGLVWLGGVYLQITCVVVSWLMLWEFLQLTLGPGERYLKAVAYVLTTVIAGAALGYLPVASSQLLLPGVTLLAFLAVLARPQPIETSLKRVSTVVLGMLYCGALFPFLARLRELEDGLAFAIMAIFCTWAADTMAYFSGRFLGRHKMYPAVSPGKTIEGAIGGWVGAVAVAFIIRALFSVELSVEHTAALGTVAAVFGIIGDLAESLLKRAVGAKDSGTLIPGHGGVLDRFDAAMFVAPAVYTYVVVVVSAT